MRMRLSKQPDQDPTWKQTLIFHLDDNYIYIEKGLICIDFKGIRIRNRIFNPALVVCLPAKLLE